MEKDGDAVMPNYALQLTRGGGFCEGMSMSRKDKSHLDKLSLPRAAQRGR